MKTPRSRSIFRLKPRERGSLRKASERPTHKRLFHGEVDHGTPPCSSPTELYYSLPNSLPRRVNPSEALRYSRADILDTPQLQADPSRVPRDQEHGGPFHQSTCSDTTSPPRAGTPTHEPGTMKSVRKCKQTSSVPAAPLTRVVL